jgi:hypothetical protein
MLDPVPPWQVWAFTTTNEGQDKLFDEGNAYLEREFPKLDSNRRAMVVDCP